MLWLLLLLLLGPLEVPAQKRPAQAPPKPVPQKAPSVWPVESVSVTGNRNYSEEQILAVAGIRPGQVAGPKEFKAARDRLAATGAFETIEFRFSPAPGKRGYAVFFRVVEAGPLFPVRFEDLGLPESELRAHLRRTDPLFGDRIPAGEPTLARYAKALEHLLASKGRKEQVAGKLMAEGAEPLHVVFRPAAPLPAVAEVRFTNNQVLPADALQRAISGVAVGALYTEKRFRLLLETSVRPLYEARGRVRVSFPEIRTEPAKDVKGLAVIVRVDEGASYDLGKVQVEGGQFPPAELLKAAGLKTGDMFNAEQIQAGAGRIEKLVRRNGYMRVKSRVERKIDDQRKAVDLVIHVEPGPQYVFGKLKIEGLDLHGEAAIQRLWTLKEGAPFNADYPDYFLARIREDQVFENLGKTRAEIKPDDKTGTVDVILHFASEPVRPPGLR